MYYEERGQGDPLIMIMGITAPGAVWEAHADDWSQHFRCIMPDNRGVGASDKPEGDYSSEMFADDYAGLMDQLGIEKARVVGVSMGSVGLGPRRGDGSRGRRLDASTGRSLLRARCAELDGGPDVRGRLPGSRIGTPDAGRATSRASAE